MDFEEYAAKPLLAAAGIAVPDSALAATAAEAADVAARIGPCVVKAQVPTGKRGKAGGIKLAATPDEARAAAEAIIGMTIGIHTVEKVLVEAQVDIGTEYYAAVMNDQASKGPLIMFSTEGGMDIEEVAADHPDKLVRLPVDIREGVTGAAIDEMLTPLGLGDRQAATSAALEKLYQVYAENDGELVEINPLVVTGAGDIVALDCKFTLEDSGSVRHGELREKAAPEKLTALEEQAQAAGLKYIDLDGDVGILANGAGLTMTTMDMRPVLRRAAGELSRDRRRGLHARQAGARTRHGKPEDQEPAGEFLRGLCPHRRDGRGHRQRLARLEARSSGLLLDSRHRRCGGGRHGARPAGHGALRQNG